MSNQDKITALYCRLSKDDLNVGDSDSIVHQRAILEKYAEDNRFPNIRVFVDDGYSGLSERLCLTRLCWKKSTGRFTTRGTTRRSWRYNLDRVS